MNRKKDKGWESPRPFKVTHQVLVISNVNFQKRSVSGHVELSVLPTAAAGLTRIRLNCKQCRIHRVCVDEQKAEFSYTDPTLEVCRHQAQQRNLSSFAAAYAAAVSTVDPDDGTGGRGELDITVPAAATSAAAGLGKQDDPKASLKVRVDFHLDQPKGGLHFVVPDMEGSMADRAAHMFSTGRQARLWFPCVDSCSELCTWRLEFTVDAAMTAVSCGDLLETVYTQDMSRKTFHYALGVPTAAPSIALAVGPFQVLADPYVRQVTHFCLPRLLPLLRHSVSFLHDAFDFYEEVLTCRYPYGCFKTVFVDEAYAQVSSYASLSVLSTNLLHGAAVIDQSPATRRCLAGALAQQYFGCFLSRASWADDWVLEGISGYVYGLYLKKTFGVNEYRHWVREELDRLVEYELKTGGVLLHPTSGGGKKRSSPTPPSHLHLSVKRPQMLSWEYGKMFGRKAHLVMRLIESHIGVKFTLQVINKLLSLAASAATQKQQAHQAWSQMLVSTHGFLKLISDVSSKDVGPLIKQWVEQSGVVKLHGSFSFNRKRNVLELEIRQDAASPGTQLYAGPVRVTVQELDGSFNHTLQLEGNSGDPSKHDIPCHSKSRRNKKKKIPLLNGEEVDMDLAAMDADSPLLWVRVDPDMSLLRRVELEQADFMWQYQLRFERDAVAQEEAAAALQRFPTPASRLALTDVLENEQCFYRVRLLACHRLAGISNAMVRTRQQQQQPGPPTLKSLFAAMFCSKRCPDIVRTNDFGDLQSYFLQRAMPVAMASLRDARKLCPRDVVRFVVDLIKYNDNSRNAFSDSYYRTDLVEALSGSLTPALAGDGSARTAGELSTDVRLVLEEISRFLNMEKRLPSFRNTVTVSCLRAVRRLQSSGHLPSDPSLFVSYAAYGHFVDVRVAALEALVDYTRAEGSAAELRRLLDAAQSDPVHYVRHKILSMLAQNPPFLAVAAGKAASVPSPLCDEALVERLWTLMNSGTSHDWRLRCDAVTLYHALFGLARPSCLPEPEPEPEPVQLRPKEKKPEPRGVDDTVTHTPPGGTDAHSSGTAGHPTADEESEPTSVGVGGVRQPPAPPPSPQDLKRKEEEETPPLVHPMELRQRGSRQRGEGKGRGGGGRYRVRFTDMEEKEDIVVETGGPALRQDSDSGDDSDHLDPPERPPTPGEGPASPVEQPTLSAHVPPVSKETSSSSPPKHARVERSRRHRERNRKRKEKGEKAKDKTPELTSTHESKDKDTEGDRVREKRKRESKEERETHAVKEKRVHEGEKKDRDRHKEKDKLLSKEKEAERDTAKKEKVRHEEKEKDTEGDHVREKHKHESKEETETYSVKEKRTHEKKDKDRHQEKDKHESKEKATERDTTKKEKHERTHESKNESKEDSETHAVRKDKHERKRERDGDRRKDTDRRETTEDGEMQTVKKDKKEERRDRDKDQRKRKREEDSDVYAVRKKARHKRDKEDGDGRKEKDRHTRESKKERDRDGDKEKRQAEEDGETRVVKKDKQQHRHDSKKDRDKHPQEGKKAKDEGGRTDKRKRKHEGQEDDDIHTARKKKRKRERQEEDRDVYKKEKHKNKRKEDRDMDRNKKKHKHEERKEMGDRDRDRRVHKSKEDDEAYAVRRKKRKHKRDMKEKDRERDMHKEKRRHKHDGKDKEDKDTSTKERHKHKKHEKDKQKDRERHKREKHREHRAKHKHKKDRERRHRTSHTHSSSQAGGISLHSTVPV